MVKCIIICLSSIVAAETRLSPLHSLLSSSTHTNFCEKNENKKNPKDTEGKGGRKSSEVKMRRGRNLKMVVLDVGPNLLKSLGSKNLLNVTGGLHLMRDFAWLHYTPNFWGRREALIPKPRSTTRSLPSPTGLSPLSIFIVALSPGSNTCCKGSPPTSNGQLCSTI